MIQHCLFICNINVRQVFDCYPDMVLGKRADVHGNESSGGADSLAGATKLTAFK